MTSMMTYYENMIIYKATKLQSFEYRLISLVLETLLSAIPTFRKYVFHGERCLPESAIKFAKVCEA